MFLNVLLVIGLGLLGVYLCELGVWVVMVFRQLGREARLAAEREAARDSNVST
jgi:hypothetical protein